MNQLVFLFGIISILQMIFLPGFLILRVLRLQLPRLRGYPRSFCLRPSLC